MVNKKLEVTLEISGRDLEILYKNEKDPKVKERLLMIIHTKEGRTTREVSKIVKKSYVMISHWINRFNREGPDGLKDRPRSGKPSKLEKEEFMELQEDIKKSPKELGYKQQFWTTRLLRMHILRKYTTSYTERHAQRLFHKFGYSLIKPRPRHIKRDPDKKEDFAEALKKTPGVWVRVESADNG